MSKRKTSSNIPSQTANARKSNPEISPSPLPKPISKSIPLAPAALEPSLYFRESSSSRPSGEKRQFSYQRHPLVNSFGSTPSAVRPDLVDELIPSLYDASTSLGSRTIPFKLPAFPQSALAMPNTPVAMAQSVPHEIARTNSKSAIAATSVAAANASSPVSKSKQNELLVFKQETFKSTDISAPSLIQNQPWYKLLPPDAFKFLVDQDVEIKSLKDKISELKTKLGTSISSSKIDIATQVSSSDLVEKYFKDIGINTDTVVEEMLIDDACTSKGADGMGKMLVAHMLN